METYFTKVASNPGINTVPENPCKLIDFAHLVLADGASYSGSTGDREVLLVILGGRATVSASNESGSETFDQIGKRANPFGGKPWSVYLPCGTEYTVTAHGNLDAGLCSAPSTLRTAPYVISPDRVTANHVGASSFARTVCNILTASDQPDLPAQSLIVGETFVPSGNWSTYPPHKHEVDDLPREAYHEELYYFKVELPGGFGHTRHYSGEHGYDATYTTVDSTLLMAPHGYHTTCSAPGYQTYFLWMLAGTGRTQAVLLDPEHQWIQKSIGLLKAER